MTVLGMRRWYNALLCQWMKRICTVPSNRCLECGQQKWGLKAGRGLYCDNPLQRGLLIAEDTQGRYIHAGFQADGSLCESGALALGWWDGEKKIPLEVTNGDPALSADSHPVISS